MEPHEIQRILDNIPNKATPQDAVDELMVAWLRGITRACAEEGEMISVEMARNMIAKIKLDAQQLVEAVIERKLGQFRNAPNN